MLTKKEFIAKIKTKYPVYNNIDDDVLYDKVIAKYPQYKEQISGTETITKSTKQPVNQKAYEMGTRVAGGPILGAIASKINPEGAITAGELAGGFTPISPAIMAVGETARARIKGNEIPGALKRGAMAAAVDIALGGTGKYGQAAAKMIKNPAVKGIVGYKGVGDLATRVGGSVLAGAAQISKRVPSWIMNRVIRDPDILATPQILPLDAANIIKNASSTLKTQSSKNFGEALSAIELPLTKKANKAVEAINAWKRANQKNYMTVPEMAKLSKRTEGMKEAFKELNKLTVKPRGLPVIIKNEGIDAGKIGALVKRELDSLGKAYSDDVVDGFFAGKRLSFDDARQINRALGSVIEKIEDAPGKGSLVRSLTKLKESNMKAMEKIGPGIRELNKTYHADKELAERALNSISSQNPEAKIEALAKQLAGKGTNRTLDARTIDELEKRLNLPLKDQLIKSIVRKEFEKTADNVLVGYGTPQALLGFGTGMAMGSQLGPLGAAATGVVGAGVGLGAGRLLEPEKLAWLIKNLPKVPGVARIATTPARIRLEQMVLGD